MSRAHPVVAITGSSGAGTSTITDTFQQIFAHEGVTAATVHGDAFHRYDREGMRQVMAAATTAGRTDFSHFGPDANLFEELEALFAQYGESGGGRVHNYVHDAEEAAEFGSPPGTFTHGRTCPPTLNCSTMKDCSGPYRPRPSTSLGTSTC